MCVSRWSRTLPGGAVRLTACGQCVECRLKYSREWAIRIVHEASVHENNAFVTLTYADNPVSLRYDDFRLFMRRLRDNRGYARYYVAGEYGEENLRPHFHAMLFGVSFPDMVYKGRSPSGERLYQSEELSGLWPHGFSSIGEVTFESAAYVARYVMKKITGPMAEEHYGERTPEFCQMSRMPGIGSRWLSKFGRSDVLATGKVLKDGKEINAPRFYGKKLKASYPFQWRKVELERYEAQSSQVDNAPERLDAREVVAKANLARSKRNV